MLPHLDMAGFRTESRGAELWIGGIDRLTSDNQQWFRELVLSSLKPEHQVVSVDLSRTVSVDSDGVGALISIHKRVRERGGSLRLMQPLPFVREMLQLLRLDRLFEIIAD